MATYEIPLTPQAQTFTVALAGVNYKFSIYWNQFSNLWILDISTDAGAPLVRGIALVANTNLLEPYDYLNFNGRLVAQTDGSPNEDPTYANLGITSHLYFII